MSLNNEVRPQEASDILTLPCPGQSVGRDDHRFRTFQLKINPPPKVVDLKNHLASFGLPRSGLKQAEMIERLRAFSENTKAWDSLLFPKQRQQRGNISEQTAKKDPLAKRTLKVFGAREVELTYQSKKSGTQTRPIEQMSAQRESANDAWATAVMRRRNAQAIGVPKDGATTDLSAAEGPQAVSQETVTGETQRHTRTGSMDIQQLTRHIGTVDRTLSIRFGAVQAQISELGTSLLAAVSAAQLTAASHTASTSAAPSALGYTTVPTDLSSHIPHLPSSDLPASSTPRRRDLDVQANRISDPASAAAAPSTPRQLSIPIPQHVTVPREAIPKKNLLIVDIDGNELAFDKTTVPDPPRVSFADDIPRLFREWHQSDILVVNGHGIPVKHWPLFYKKRIGIKKHAWEKARVLWGNWRFLVMERERFPSEDAFWNYYTDSEGKRLNFQKILDSLKVGRMTDSENLKDAAAALWFFSGDLGQPAAHGYFLYKKNSKHFVCKKTEFVTRKWRKLLCDHEDVAELWELARAAFELVPPSADDI